jgi:hypothetical protein
MNSCTSSSGSDISLYERNYSDYSDDSDVGNWADFDLSASENGDIQSTSSKLKDIWNVFVGFCRQVFNSVLNFLFPCMRAEVPDDHDKITTVSSPVLDQIDSGDSVESLKQMMKHNFEEME